MRKFELVDAALQELGASKWRTCGVGWLQALWSPESGGSPETPQLSLTRAFRRAVKFNAQALLFVGVLVEVSELMG